MTEHEIAALIGTAAAYPAEVAERLGWFQEYIRNGSVSATCRRFGIARTTFYRWWRRFDPARLGSLADAPTLVTHRATPPAHHERSTAFPALPAPGLGSGGRLLPVVVFSGLLCNLLLASTLLLVLWRAGSGTAFAGPVSQPPSVQPSVARSAP